MPPLLKCSVTPTPAPCLSPGLPEPNGATHFYGWPGREEHTQPWHPAPVQPAWSSLLSILVPGHSTQQPPAHPRLPSASGHTTIQRPGMSAPQLLPIPQGSRAVAPSLTGLNIAARSSAIQQGTAKTPNPNAL